MTSDKLLPVGVFTAHVLMIRPAAFGFNAETAASNGFARALTAGDAAACALREFDAMATALVRADLTPWIWHDTPEPIRPDAVYPNNWLSTHRSGRVHIYPMASPSRRAEVDRSLLGELDRRYRITELVDWTEHAARGEYLEGTGSLVLDATRRLAYASTSSRTNPSLVRAWAAREGYTPVIFDAHDARGRPLYHTNVLLCVGHGFSACGLALVPEAQRGELRAHLTGGGACIELDPSQIDRFAGNMMQLVNNHGAPVCVLSQNALTSLRPEQRRALERHTALLPVDLATIEAVGGGGARCMLAELFLAPR